MTPRLPPHLPALLVLESLFCVHFWSPDQRHGIVRGASRVCLAARRFSICSCSSSPFSFFKFVAQSDEIASAAPSPPRFSLSQDSVLIRKYSARFTIPLPVLVGNFSPPIQ